MGTTSVFLGVLLGIMQICMALAYLAISIRQTISTTRSGRIRSSDLRLLQAVFGPIIILISGSILISQGWRQDPILLSKDALMSILIGYLIILDLMKSYRNS